MIVVMRKSYKLQKQETTVFKMQDWKWNKIPFLLYLFRLIIK
jgi:hypothetical protein